VDGRPNRRNVWGGPHTAAFGRSSKRQRLLAATAKGRKWLAQPAADRLRELLFEMRHPHKDRFANYNDPFSDTSNSFSFEGTETGDFDQLGWLDSIWRQTPDEGCVALNAFLDYHAHASDKELQIDVVGHP
jgi:hypothetical protein